MTGSLATLKQLLQELKGAKKNQTVKDLDRIANDFGCETVLTNSANENRIYYSPIKPKRVPVAMPHKGKVLAPYVVKFIRMLEEIIEAEESKQSKEGGTFE